MCLLNFQPCNTLSLHICLSSSQCPVKYAQYQDRNAVMLLRITVVFVQLWLISQSENVLCCIETVAEQFYVAGLEVSSSDWWNLLLMAFWRQSDIITTTLFTWLDTVFTEKHACLLLADILALNKVYLTFLDPQWDILTQTLLTSTTLENGRLLFQLSDISFLSGYHGGSLFYAALNNGFMCKIFSVCCALKKYL